jgi:hypothetical protein
MVLSADGDNRSDNSEDPPPTPDASPSPETPPKDEPAPEETSSDSPPEDLPTEDSPPEDLPTEDLPTEDSPTEDLPTEDSPTEDSPPVVSPPVDSPPPATPPPTDAATKDTAPGTCGRVLRSIDFTEKCDSTCQTKTFSPAIEPLHLQPLVCLRAVDHHLPQVHKFVGSHCLDTALTQPRAAVITKVPTRKSPCTRTSRGTGSSNARKWRRCPSLAIHTTWTSNLRRDALALSIPTAAA